MRLSKWASGVVALALVVGPVSAGLCDASGQPAVVASVKAFIEHYREVARGRDLDATVDCFDDDATLLPPDGEILRGRAAVRAGYTKFFADFEPVSVTFSDERTFAAGDVAVHQGESTYAERRRADGLLQTFRSRWLYVLTRNGGGPWRIRSYAWQDLPTSGSRAEQGSDGDRARILANIRRFEDAFSRGDAATVASLYTTDGQVLLPGAPPAVGRPAIEQLWKSGMLPGRRLVLTPVELEVSSGLAYEMGLARGFDPDGTVVDDSRYVAIWRRDADGEWRLHRDAVSSNVPVTADSREGSIERR